MDVSSIKNIIECIRKVFKTDLFIQLVNFTFAQLYYFNLETEVRAGNEIYGFLRTKVWCKN